MPFSPVHSAPVRDISISMSSKNEREKENRTEILCCFWDKVVVELKDDPPCRDTCDRDIEEGDLSFAHLHAKTWVGATETKVPLNKYPSPNYYYVFYVSKVPTDSRRAESAEPEPISYDF